MTNLLRANLFRLWKDRIFRLCLFADVACTAVVTYLQGRDDVKMRDVYGMETSLDELYFMVIMVLGLIIGVLVCMYLNTEYSEGTVRNKLAVGHTRGDVYLSNFLTMAAAALVIQLGWMAAACVAIPLVGGWTGGVGKLLLMLLLVTGTNLALAAIFTFIGMLDSGRSSIVLTVVVWFTMLMAASYVYSVLTEPEEVAYMTMVVDGVPEIISEKNPHYVSGALRSFYEFVMDFLPLGQVARIQNQDMGDPVRMLLCSAFITVAATWGGMGLFRKKDVK